MKVVIDIDENVFTRLFDNGAKNCELAKTIRKGIPLPKGHGRILDEKDILDTENNNGGWYDLVDMPEYIAGVKAIIEADNSQGSEMLSADRRLDNLLQILEDVVPKKYEPENEVSKE